MAPETAPSTAFAPGQEQFALREGSDTPPPDIDKFREWFREKVVANGNSERRTVPPTITAMPCGCSADPQQGATAWSIESEPSQDFGVFRTSMVMVHPDCGNSVGEIPTPWAVF